MSNYYIGVDENGQPYFAHKAVPNTENAYGGKKRRNKYLQKIDNFYKNGKALYLYTQDEVRNFANHGKQKIDKAIGISAKKKRNEARDLFNQKSDNARVQKARAQAYGRAQEEYSKSLLGKMEYAQSITKIRAHVLKNNAKKTLGEIRSKASATKDKVVDRAKDLAGYDERERYLEADAKARQESAYHNNYVTNVAKGQAPRNAGYERYVAEREDQARMAADSAKREYDRTLVGRVDNLKNKVKRKK